MYIKIVIIENNLKELQELKKELNIWSNKYSIQIVINSYPSGELYFSKHGIFDDDIYFLDIQLDGMSGLDIAKNLRLKNYNGEIVFLTAFREYVFEGYQVHALNYLIKPIKKTSLYLCMNEVSNKLIGNSYIFRNKQEIVQIPYHDILVFSSNLHYVDILSIKGRFCQHANLKNILEHLPKEFIRTHRCYIVNMAHIYKICGNVITLSNNMTVQIGRKYLNSVRDEFTKYTVRFDKN